MANKLAVNWTGAEMVAAYDKPLHDAYKLLRSGMYIVYDGGFGSYSPHTRAFGSYDIIAYREIAGVFEAWLDERWRSGGDRGTFNYLMRNQDAHPFETMCPVVFQLEYGKPL